MSTGVLADLRTFLFRRPAIATHVPLTDEEARENYGLRIRKRLGVGVHEYSVFNVHRIGIDAPVEQVFAMLRSPITVATCWPSHLARIERRRDRERVLFLGIRRLPLFDLTPVEAGPETLLFKSSGGYPVGVLSMYVRPSIPESDETGESQFFFIVGFDFYGRRPRIPLVHRVWRRIHDRATANILGRFKELCEWSFLNSGSEGGKAATPARGRGPT